MLDSPRHRTIDEYQSDAERVREYYRKQGEDRMRDQILDLMIFERDRTASGTFDANGVLAKLIAKIQGKIK
jgi:hypothetical protein